MGGGGLHRPWDPVSKKLRTLNNHLGLSPMRPNELWTYPDDGAARAQAPCCQRSSCGSVRRGRGGDWCNQRRSEGWGWGSGYPRSPTLRNDPGTVTIPQYWFNKNKVTHTPYAEVEYRVWIPNLGALQIIVLVSLTHLPCLFACFYDSMSYVYVFFSTCLSTCVASAARFVFSFVFITTFLFSFFFFQKNKCCFA